MKLYGYWRSSCTWRVRIALAYKGLEHQYIPINLIKEGGEQHREDYGAVNPLRQVPVLEIEVGGAPLRLGQSLAIIELLEERHPEPRMLPTDRYLRARRSQIDLLMDVAKSLQALLTPEQRRKLPASVLLSLDPRYLDSIRNGSGLYVQGASSGAMFYEVAR